MPYDENEVASIRIVLLLLQERKHNGIVAMHALMIDLRMALFELFR